MPCRMAQLSRLAYLDLRDRLLQTNVRSPLGVAQGFVQNGFSARSDPDTRACRHRRIELPAKQFL